MLVTMFTRVTTSPVIIPPTIIGAAFTPSELLIEKVRAIQAKIERVDKYAVRTI